MTNLKSPKRYDLEDRTLSFAQRTRELVKRLPKSLSNFEDGKQLLRSSGSVGVFISKPMSLLAIKILFIELKSAEKRQKKVDTGSDH